MNKETLKAARKEIGRQLDAIRKKKGITKIEISHTSGLARTQLYDLFKGERSYTFDTLLRVLSSLGYGFNLANGEGGTINLSFTEEDNKTCSRCNEPFFGRELPNMDENYKPIPGFICDECFKKIMEV